MSENKRLLAAGAVIVGIIVLILLISFWPKSDNNFVCNIKADGSYSKLGVVNYKQYTCLTKEKGKKAVVVADKMTKSKKAALNKAATKIGQSIYYLNTKSINKKDLKAIKKKLSYNDKSFAKDVILVVEKGKVAAYKEDILTKSDDVKDFLKENKLAKYACDATPSEEYPNLARITYKQYNCLYESEEPFAVILSQTTCGYCKQFKPYINEYVGKENLPLYFIEINELSEEESNALQASLSYFKDNDSWGTPLTLGIKNKEVITEINGYTDDDDEVDQFFKKLGLK